MSFPNVTTTDDAPLPDKIPFEERLKKSSNLKKIYDKMPKHLHGLFEKSIVHLYDEQAIAVGEMLTEFEDVFAKDDFDIGYFNGGIVHDIDTGDAVPIKARMRHTPLGFKGEEQKLLKTKVIKPSISDWASAPVLIRKKDGTVRYCIDFRPLNGKTVKSVAMLPLISEAIDCLADNVWCSTLDWNSGYYQLLLNPKDCHKTAFITKFGLFEFLCMPFSLCNAPSTFQQVVQFIFSGMLWKEVLAYLDDIFVLGKSFKGHLLNIRKALLRLRKYNLKLKPRKCILFQTEVPFLGRLVGQNGIFIDAGKIEIVKKWPVPRNIQELQSFLGFVNYQGDHIKDFAVMTESLYDLTRKKKNKSPTEWTDEHDKAFENVKDILINAPVLAFPHPDDTFILDMDASNSANWCCFVTGTVWRREIYLLW